MAALLVFAVCLTNPSHHDTDVEEKVSKPAEKKETFFELLAVLCICSARSYFLMVAILLATLGVISYSSRKTRRAV